MEYGGEKNAVHNAGGGCSDGVRLRLAILDFDAVAARFQQPANARTMLNVLGEQRLSPGSLRGSVRRWWRVVAASPHVRYGIASGVTGRQRRNPQFHRMRCGA
ncbi:MAG: hypothetical protein ACRESW_02765 [Nevskiales bacterium]